MQKRIRTHFKSTLVFLSFFLLSNKLIAQSPATGLFKDWTCTPSEVIGLIKLSSVNNRGYYKISWIDTRLTEIRKYNAAGNLTTTTVIEFYNGKLRKQTNINQWNDTAETYEFTYDGGNNFSVCKQKNGRNEFSPSKYARYLFADDGTLQQIQYLSDSNRLINNANGVAIILYKRYTDTARFGETKEAAYFDSNYKPVVFKSLDYHRVIYERDDNNNQVSRKYLDTADMPVKTRNMIAEVRSKYDTYGQVLEEDKYDSIGNLTADAFGIAKNKYEYENGFIVKESRFNVYGYPANASEEGDGIAVIKYQNDIRGNHIEKTYYNERGQMLNGKNGYHKIVYQYNNQDMMMSYALFNTLQLPVSDPYGVHQYSYTRDSKGRIIQLKYWDNNNRPCTDKLDKVYMVKYVYDSLGRTISNSYWYNEWIKMKRWNGYYASQYKYDKAGRIIEYLYLDENGIPIKNNSGYSRLQLDYNSNGLKSKLSLFNEDTAATMTIASIMGYHAIQYYFSTSNLIDSLSYFGTNNEPSNATIQLDNNIKILAHKIQFIYKGNTIIEERFYISNNNEPSTIIDCVKNNYVLANGVGTKFRTTKNSGSDDY